MFKNIDYTNSIPLNFIQSILTNPSLYGMFKNEFDLNREYFQNIEKSIYLQGMLDYIENILFSSNLFHIYSEDDDLDEITNGKLKFIKDFYEDFLLEAFKEEPSNILKTRFFRGLKYALDNDRYASKTDEFNALFDYVFKESLDYEGIVEVLLKEPLALLKNREALPLKSFDILCNYVKNNIDGSVGMDIVMPMLHNHAYKKNHIFDHEVAKILNTSFLSSYLGYYDIPVTVEYTDGSYDEEETPDAFTIHIDNSLIEKFCSLNYIELFSKSFYEADILRDRVLLKENRISKTTLDTVMNLVTLGLNPKVIVETPNLPSEYTEDLLASSFVKVLKFYSTFGVNLFDAYINSKTQGLSFDIKEEDYTYSKKEISLDQRFDRAFKKFEQKKELLEFSSVLNMLYDREGKRISTLNLIKSIPTSEHREFLIEYLHSRILDPLTMIEDVNTLSSYRPRNDEIKDLIDRELEYIYVDTFFYSLDSFLKLNTKIDKEEYLSDILTKVNCIKSTPLTHRFIDEATETINNVQNICS